MIPQFVLVTFAAFVIATVGYFFFKNNTMVKNSEKNPAIENLDSSRGISNLQVVTTDASPLVEKEKPLSQEPIEPVQKFFDPESLARRVEEYQVAFTVEEREEINRLGAERGYYTNLGGVMDPIFAGYLDYDDATLLEIASLDDMRASSILAERSVESQDLNAAKKHHLDAITLGSMNSIGMMKGLYTYVLTKKIRTENPNKYNQFKLEQRAWNEVLKMRGDKTKDHYQYSALTDSEQAEVKRLAEEFYGDLERRRKEKELAPFDNSTPKLMQAHYDFFMAALSD